MIAALDQDQFIVRDNLYTIIPQTESPDLRFVLAVLNSSLLNWFYQHIVNPEEGEALAQVKRGHLAMLPIRRIAFTTPADERARLAETSWRLYEAFCADGVADPIMAFVAAQLAAEPERSDVVHDLLATLAEQMIDLNKGRQKLEAAIAPFKFLDRSAACQPFTRAFADAIKYGQLVRPQTPNVSDTLGVSPPLDLTAVHHDVEALRLLPTAAAPFAGETAGGHELQAYLEHRDPATDWTKWGYDEQGHIIHTWVPVYRFELTLTAARFWTHALPVLDQFANVKKFSGGRTRSTLAKLHAELTAVKTRIERTDALIAQIVYRLYGLTNEEIALVGSTNFTLTARTRRRP